MEPFHFFFTLSCAEVRWQEVSISILKSLGHEITFTSQLSENDVNIDVFVDGTLFEELLKAHPIARADVLKKHVVQVTRVFNKRLQLFIKTILMANFDGCLPVEFYNYRVEMQLRGMAHVHGCL